MASPAVQ